MSVAPQASAVPPQLAQALSGPLPGPQGLPPELMAMLSGAGQGPPDHGQTPGSWTDHLRAAIEEAQAAAAAAPDDQHSQMIHQMVAGLYKIMVSQQDQKTQAMGGNPTQMRALGQAYGG
jgi:hypothetical protein